MLLALVEHLAHSALVEQSDGHLGSPYLRTYRLFYMSALLLPSLYTQLAGLLSFSLRLTLQRHREISILKADVLDAAQIQVGTANRRFSTLTFGPHGFVTSFYAIESYYMDPRQGLSERNIGKALREWLERLK